MKTLLTDDKASRFPVSVKGVVCYKGEYLLRRNERQEWELLGGKLEKDESPKACVVRELAEEAGIQVTAHALRDAWVYKVSGIQEVLILTYECTVQPSSLPIRSLEGAELQWFAPFEIYQLNMPDGYKQSIRNYQNEFFVC